MLLPCSTYHNLLKIQIHCHASPAPVYLSYIISYHSFPLSQAPTILASSECSVIVGPSGEMLFLCSVSLLRELYLITLSTPDPRTQVPVLRIIPLLSVSPSFSV